VLLLGGWGFAQWLVLRRSVQRAGLWLLAEAVALGIGLLVAVLSYRISFLAAAIYGALSGAALVWVLRRSAGAGGSIQSLKTAGLQPFVILGVLALIAAPLSAAESTRSFQHEVFCERLALGTPRERIYPHIGDPGPVPREVAAYSAQVVAYARYWYRETGLGFDAADRVALVVRERGGRYYQIDCPWTFVDYFGTLP
jgi:hypothetical protein